MGQLDKKIIAWLAELTQMDEATIAAGGGVHAPIDKAGAVLDAITANDGGGTSSLGPGGGAPDPAGSAAEDLNFQRTGPLLRVGMNPDGTPIKGLEINAGQVNTDVGLPPDPTTGDFVDPSLIDLQRTDIQRAGNEYLNANEPIPAGMKGQYDFVLGNNPKDYVPNLENVADLVKPGGRIIMQGRTRANADFTEMLNNAAPQGKPLNPPKGTTVVPEMVDASGNPMPFRPGGITVKDGQTVAQAAKAGQTLGGEANPADIMGEGFRYNDGNPTVQRPNARLILEKNQPAPDTKGGGGAAGTEPPATEPSVTEPSITEPPVTEPPVTKAPAAGRPVTEPPVSAAPAGGEAEAAAGAEAGFGGAVKGGLLGAGIEGGMALADDWSKVENGQMSVGDAAVDVGGKAAKAGVLTFGGTAVADAVVGGGGAEAAALSAGGEALAGAAGGEAGAVAGAASLAGVALKGGVIGGVVAGGAALIDDIGKVRSGEMTGGTATVDVTAKTAIGVGAGLAGAAAGAEIGAVIGTAIPIPILGTAAGFVAGAVVGGAVGYVGNKLMNTEIGQEIVHGAGKAVDAAIDGVEDAGKFVAKEAGAALDEAEALAGKAGHAIADGAGALAKEAEAGLKGAEKAAEAAGHAVADGAKAVAKKAEAAAKAAEKLAEGAGHAVAEGAEAVGKGVAEAAKKAESVAEDAGRAVEAGAKAVAEEAAAAVQTVENVASKAADAVEGAAGKAVDAVEDAASSAWDKVTSLL